MKKSIEKYGFICLHCRKKFNGDRKKRKFCSRVCANRFNPEGRSKSLKKFWDKHPEKKEEMSLLISKMFSRPEAKEKLRRDKLGDRNPAKRPEVREKIKRTVERLWELGVYRRHRKPETKKKIRDSLRNGDYKICEFCGKQFWVCKGTLDERRFCGEECHSGYMKSDEYVKVMSGKGNPNWRGGTSRLPYPYEFGEELKEIVRTIWGNICVVCLEEPDNENLSTHHVDYNKNNNELANLLPLCRNCHSLTLSNRKFWEEYFRTEIIPLVFVY